MAIDPSISLRVNVPQMADPLEAMSRMLSLRDLASRGRLETLKVAEAERDLEGQRVLRETFGQHTQAEQGQIDYPAIITDLRRKGYPDLALKIRDEWEQEQDRVVAGVKTRLNEHKTIYGQGAQLLQEVKRRPDVYPSVRTKLVELAGAIDPRLTSEIPETYDEARVTGMLQFTMDAAKEAGVRARGADELAASLKARDDALERTTRQHKALGHFFSQAHGAEDWAWIQGHARTAFGIPEETVRIFGEWSPDAPARAAAVGGEKLEAVTTRDAAGRETTQYLPVSQLPGRKFVKQPAPKTTEGMSAGNRRAMTDAVLKNPSLWSDLTQTAKSDIAVELFGRGFMFPQSARARDVAERWRQNSISALHKLYKESQQAGPGYGRMTDEERAIERRRLEDSYRVQIGQPPLTNPEWATMQATLYPPTGRPAPGTSAPPPPAPAAAPPPARPTAPARGDIALPSEVPTEIRQLLAAESPGTYTLVNEATGKETVWAKTATGQIRKVR